MARTCGGTGNDTAYGGLVVDESGNAFEAGMYVGQVDFGPLIGITTNPPFHGAADAFLAQIPTARRFTVIKSGNGSSSLGTDSPAVRLVSVGVSTQIVYSSAEWNRILALASNNIPVGAAAGMKVFTQAVINVAADLSNDISFVMLTTDQTGYVDVPVTWLTNWAESAIITDTAFSVSSKYLIGLDPTTSNAFDLAIESLSVEDTNVVVVLKRTYSGGLSPDGMHGQLTLQKTEVMGDLFSNVTGTAATGAGVYDATGRKTFTNAFDGTTRFVRAVIQ